MNSQNHPLKKWQFKALVATAALCLIGSAAWSQNATVTVNAGSVINPVPPQGYGVNAALWDTNVISSQLPAIFDAAGISAVRFPGGSWSDCYHWQADTGTPATNPPDYPGCSLNVYPGANFDSFMTTDVNPAGAHAIVVVNYGSNTAGTGGGDPNEAAAWVKHANVTNNWNVEYWEIGNEIGGNGYFGNPGWEFDLHYPYNGNRAGQAALSPEAYANNTLAYISAMKAVDPNIKIGVGVWCPDTNNDNPRLFNTLASKLDFLIVHWYPGSSAISKEASLASYVATIRNQMAAAGGNRNIPFAITETNADGAFSAPLDAVWNVDNYLTWFELGAANVDYWELFDSNAVLTSLTSPNDPYYAIQFSHTIAGVGDNLVSTSSSNSLVRSHAVVRTDGSVGVLLLNENSGSSTVSVSISGATVSSSGTEYTLNPYGTTTSSSISGIGNSFSVTVPGSTAIGIVIPAGAAKGSFTLAPSASSVSVAQGASATDTITVKDVSPFTGSVTLAASGLPAGVTATFGANPAAASSVVTFAASSTAAAGTSTVTVTGTNGSLSATTAIALTVTVPCTPTAINAQMNVGGVWTAESSATVASTTAVVDLGPQPLTGGTWAWSGPNGFTSALREIDSIPLYPGVNVYTATYTNSCGAKSTQAFTITAPGGSFTLAASPSSLSVAQGAKATDTITVTDAGGFTGSVTLAASGLPSGVTAAFATNPTASTSVVTFTASSSATVGTSTVTIAGTSGSLSATTPISLTVTKTSGTLIANGTYIVTAVNSGSAIDDPGSSTTNGTDQQIYTVNDGTNQQWTVNNVSANVITLTSVASGQLLDVAADSKTSGALVDQWPANGQTNQEWNVISVAGGAFELTSVNSGLALSVVGGGTANKTGVEQLTYSGSTSQQWKFTSY